MNTPDPEHLSAAEPPPELCRLAIRLQKALDGYCVETPLGRGGMGAVFLAHHLKLDRPVAVKALLPAPEAAAGWQERFEREARALARLQHPGIVGVYDYGQEDDLAWIVMEYVDGASLRQLLEEGRLSPEEALSIVPQICSALQYAHDRGVVHRDVKPENVLLDEAGQVKIADFGLAKLMDGGNTAQLTGSAQAMGTLRYMAPEQLERPREVDHRADIFSLGVVLYEMLTGHVPAGVVDPPSKQAPIDRRVDEVVLRSMEREPARRFQRADEVGGRLEELRAPAAARAEAPAHPAAPDSSSSPVRLRLRIASAVVAILSLTWMFGPWGNQFARGLGVSFPMGFLYGATLVGLVITVLVLGDTRRGLPAALIQIALSGMAGAWVGVHCANFVPGSLPAIPAAAAGSAGLLLVLGLLQLFLREDGEPSVGDEMRAMGHWFDSGKNEE